MSPLEMREAAAKAARDKIDIVAKELSKLDHFENDVWDSIPETEEARDKLWRTEGYEGTTSQEHYRDQARAAIEALSISPSPPQSDSSEDVLRKEIADLNEVIVHVQGSDIAMTELLAKARTERDQARADYAHAHQKLIEANNARQVLSDDLVRLSKSDSGEDALVEALDPFAQLAERYKKLPDDYPLWGARFQIDLPPVITIGHFRKARAVLDAYRAARKEQA